jgi:hypothetical protein
MTTGDELRGRCRGLSIEQLEELIEEQESDEMREVLVDVLQQRRDRQTGEAPAPARKKRGRTALRAEQPRDIATNSADLFMQDEERAAAWREALVEATDENGNVALTGRIVQLAVGAYYAERRAQKRKRVSEAKVVSEAAPEPVAAQAEAEPAQLDDVNPDDLLLSADLVADGFLPIRAPGEE